MSSPLDDVNGNTWLARVAQRYRSSAFVQGAGAALMGYLAGLIPDMLDEALTHAATTCLPIRGVTMPSALPLLLRAFGLPTYDGETYAATLDRLEDAWPTHARAGTLGGLTTEINRLPGFEGFASAVAPSGFRIRLSTPAIALGRTYSGQAYGTFVYGVTVITPAQNERVRALAMFWKPARSRYLGVYPS